MDSTHVLNKTMLSDSCNEISSSESSENFSTNERISLEESNPDPDVTEVFIEESLPYQIYNYVYNKKTEFALMHTPFWEAFKVQHPNVSLTPVELKMQFFEKILPGFKRFTWLTSYQKKYFDTMYDFYKDFDIEKLRTNDPVPGIHYYRADDNDTFRSLLNRPDVNIIGITENVNYDIYNDVNTSRLFQMSENMRLCYSAFLRNADEIQNNVLLEHVEITKRIRIYFAEGKTLPTISEINEILKSSPSRFAPTSSLIMPYAPTSSLIDLLSPLDSQSSSDSRAELSRYFDKITSLSHKARKPRRNTKTLRKMQNSLRNPKLKELERKAKAAKQRFRKYL